VLQTGNLLSGGKRSAHFYRPPVEEPVALIVVWDGGDYLRRAKLATIVDNMIHAGRIRPVALAMVENGGPARMVEYSCGEATLWFILRYLLPEACSRLNLIDYGANPGAFGVMGASLGGLMALYTGLRLPQIFGYVLAQSGAYEINGFDFVTSTLVDHGPKLPLKIWMDAGKFEYLIDTNRRMHQKLEARGYQVIYREYSAGHNYPAWRDDLPRGLEYLFG
jgi:enterochelin esterase-like enzyme